MDRRQSVRVSVLGVLHGKSDTVSVPMVVRDVSDGGCAIESTHAFSVGEHHRLELSGPHGRMVVVDATVTHCLRMPVESGRTRHLAGFEFVVTTAVQQGLARMLADLAVSQ